MNEERLELKPSPISSWRLETGNFLESTSRHAHAAAESQDIGASVSLPRRPPPRSSVNRDFRRTSVRYWVQFNATHPPPPPEVIDLQDSDVNDLRSAAIAIIRCAVDTQEGIILHIFHLSASAVSLR